MEVRETERAGASPDAIQHHYDIGDEFYELWLDDTLSYTCAMWADGDGLESAQTRKTEYLIEAARAQGAERVVDIGCGWGGTMRQLVDRHGVGLAAGVTMSPAQQRYIEAWDDERCPVYLEDWGDHDPEQPYDAVIAAGVIEHAVKFGRPRAEKVAAYRRFMEKCHELLEPGGRLALQTICKGNVPLSEKDLEDAMFISRDIFPESDLPKLAELAHAAEKLFEVKLVRNDRSHYVRTLAEWRRRLLENRERCIEAVGEHLVEQYDTFLEASRRQFEQGQLGLLRLTLERVN
jgi:cyclopropane-fatty-acyl-phospholipid synthase